MPDIFFEAWQFLAAMPFWTILTLFWLIIFVELPRYMLGIQVTVGTLLLSDGRHAVPNKLMPKASILLVGHNEEATIERCVRSLYEQTFRRFEIICVDDGSSDGTYRIMKKLRREGLVHATARLDLRGGKASGINLAARLAKEDILVVIDCDCSFEADAIEQLLLPLAEDPHVSAVSGNILVRNWQASIVSSLQAIEYLLAISLGKEFSDSLNQVTCVSGAFGAFRREPWEACGGMDIGGGEDLDFTLRLRAQGRLVVFARNSICYTDVPDSLHALWKQRNRWERDAIWVRYRKGWRVMSPFSGRFDWREAIHQWDFILFNILPTLVFPFYVVWLLVTFGRFGLLMLISVSLALLVLDVVAFAGAVLATGKPAYWRLLAFIPIFGLFQTAVMRMNRLYAYVTEIIFSPSLKDNYVPQKVRDLVYWR